MRIRYTTGDATRPIPSPIIIPHVVNDIGAWGAGFVVALSKRWDSPEHAYNHWPRREDGWSPPRDSTVQETGPFELGQVQFVEVAQGGDAYTPLIKASGAILPKILVANMCAQRAVRSQTNRVPLQMDALEKCMYHVTLVARRLGATIHAPRFGSGLAGGRWGDIEHLIQKLWIDEGIPVIIYDYQDVDTLEHIREANSR